MPVGLVGCLAGSGCGVGAYWVPPSLLSFVPRGWGALALPSPHPLGPHPNPPTVGHSSGSFSFFGREEGEGSCQAGNRVWGRILEQQALEKWLLLCGRFS